MNKLKLLREQAGMTQTELGKLLNVKDAAISKYESGKVPLTGETLLQLSKIFNVSIDYLLGNEFAGIDYASYTMDVSEFGNEFKERLRNILNSRNISYSKFAEIAGFHQEEADLYLYGNKIPSPEQLIKIAGALNVSSDYLLGIGPEKPMIEEDRILSKSLTEREENVIDVFRQLNDDNKDIIVGEMKKCLKEQRYEEAVAAAPSMREAK